MKAPLFINKPTNGITMSKWSLNTLQIDQNK